MGDWTYEVSTSDTPKDPDAQPLKRKVEPQPCHACKSEETVCVREEGGGSIVGTWSEKEFRCERCGIYTTYVVEYDS